MQRLNTCFNEALGFLGGLGALAEAASVPAAEALDNKIAK